jgi:hypothetical protein
MMSSILASILIVTLPPSGVNFMAFDRKLRKICMYLRASPSSLCKQSKLFLFRISAQSKIFLFKAVAFTVSKAYMITFGRLKSSLSNLNTPFYSLPKSMRSFIRFSTMFWLNSMFPRISTASPQHETTSDFIFIWISYRLL